MFIIQSPHPSHPPPLHGKMENHFLKGVDSSGTHIWPLGLNRLPSWQANITMKMEKAYEKRTRQERTSL